MSPCADDHRSESPQDTLSASVSLVRAGPGPVTSADVRDRLPDAGTVAAAQEGFRELGFEVGDAFGGTFSITGDRSTFAQAFPSWNEDRFDPEALAGASEDELELPVGDVREHLGEAGRAAVAIFFTARPDFGPGNP